MTFGSKEEDTDPEPVRSSADPEAKPGPRDDSPTASAHTSFVQPRERAFPRTPPTASPPVREGLAESFPLLFFGGGCLAVALFLERSSFGFGRLPLWILFSIVGGVALVGGTLSVFADASPEAPFDDVARRSKDFVLIPRKFWNELREAYAREGTSDANVRPPRSRPWSVSPEGQVQVGVRAAGPRTSGPVPPAGALSTKVTPPAPAAGGPLPGRPSPLDRSPFPSLPAEELSKAVPELDRPPPVRPDPSIAAPSGPTLPERRVPEPAPLRSTESRPGPTLATPPVRPVPRDLYETVLQELDQLAQEVRASNSPRPLRDLALTAVGRSTDIRPAEPPPSAPPLRPTPQLRVVGSGTKGQPAAPPRTGVSGPSQPPGSAGVHVREEVRSRASTLRPVSHGGVGGGPAPPNQLVCVGCGTPLTSGGRTFACRLCSEPLCADCRGRARSEGYPELCPACALLESVHSSSRRSA